MMRISQYPLFTLRKVPFESEIISHQLMLRAGIVRKLSSGMHTWLPIGLRVLNKIKNIIREEMNNAGSIEISMPMVQPVVLWKKSKRLEEFGPELLKFSDRSGRFFVLGPTHEEVITNLIKNEIRSYKELPLNFFQIQTKFRDEMRPRFGVIRSKEFLMKDAYSFHISKESLEEHYKKMYKIYKKIFSRIGLNFYTMQANTGSIGGITSHEFYTLIKKQNSKFSFKKTDFSEKLNFFPFIKAKKQKINIGKNKISEKLIKKFDLPIGKNYKTVLLRTKKESKYLVVILIMHSNCFFNKKKAEKLSQVSIPLSFIEEEETFEKENKKFRLIDLNKSLIQIVIDQSLISIKDRFFIDNTENIRNFSEKKLHENVIIKNFSDNLKLNLLNGHNLEKKNETPTSKYKIEIGHIFQLGTKYSESLNTFVQDENGCNRIVTMGCYGIGITRVVASIIEQSYDENGIIWPDNIAPFQVAVIPINMHKFSHIQKLAEKIYTNLRLEKIEVLIDDRKEHPGVMFSDIDLIGIPNIVIISNQNFKNGFVEYKHRQNKEKKLVSIKKILDFLIKKISKI